MEFMLHMFFTAYRGDAQNLDEHVEPESALLWISESIWNQHDGIGKFKRPNGEVINQTEGYQT